LRVEAVRAGQVDQFDRLVADHATGLSFDRHARKIPHALVKAGQEVEDGGLTGIGIACKRHPFNRNDDLGLDFRFAAGLRHRTTPRGWSTSPRQTATTSICAASSFRMASWQR